MNDPKIQRSGPWKDTQTTKMTDTLIPKPAAQPAQERWHWDGHLGRFARNQNGVVIHKWPDQMDKYVTALEAEVEALKEERSLLLDDADEIHAMETANRDLQAEVEALRVKAELADRLRELVREMVNEGAVLTEGDEILLDDFDAVKDEEPVTVDHYRIEKMEYRLPEEPSTFAP